MSRFVFYIEILGSGQCNLRCPTCAVGNSDTVRNPMGLMRRPLLERIMTKATSECTVAAVGLYNWAEPLLHPELPQLVETVQSFGVPAHLSSNLNYAPNLVELMRANPAEFRISVSGFSQEHYGVTHRGGDIEVVKRSMRRLAEAKESTGATTRIHVAFHRYRDNVDEELRMAEYAAELGFDFFPMWAYMTPLEKVLAYVDGDASIARLDDDDRAVMARLMPAVDDALALSQRHRGKQCALLEEQVTLDFRGDVLQCCAVYDARAYRVTSFLDEPLAAIQSKRRAASICARCTRRALHVYYTYGAGAELDELANAQRTAYLSGQRSPAMATGGTAVSPNESSAE